MTWAGSNPTKPIGSEVRHPPSPDQVDVVISTTAEREGFEPSDP